MREIVDLMEEVFADVDDTSEPAADALLFDGRVEALVWDPDPRPVTFTPTNWTTVSPMSAK